MAELSPKEIDGIVDAILKKDTPGKRRHDPVDDLDALTRFAVYCLPGVRDLPGFVDVPPMPSLTGRHAAGRELIRFAGFYLEAINPSLTAFDWGRIYHRLLLRRNGIGTPVRIRKRPALALREDAKRLSFKQMRAKYPDHRDSILYRYLNEASKARRRK